MVRPLLARLDVPEETLSGPSSAPLRLPDGATDYLRPDHPRLAELRERYRRFNAPVTQHSWWSDDFVGREVDLRAFRGDGAYVWQLRDFNTGVHYIATAYYTKEIDRLGLLRSLEEDDLFGARTHRFGESLTISRDLLDSVLELNFLDRHTGLSGWNSATLLDIGAGYGRLAYRAARGLPNLNRILCTDAIAESTFLCEYYLRFRGVDAIAETVPADAIVDRLANVHVDIATNVHSFSECSLGTVTWWLDLVASRDIRFLMIVPNALDNGGNQLLAREADGSLVDFLPEIVKRGYTLVVKEPKYLDPLVQRHGVTPTHYWLFRREESQGTES